MVESATILVGYKTYPHIDLFKTGAECGEAHAADFKGYFVSGDALPQTPAYRSGRKYADHVGPFGHLILRASELEQSGAACCVSIFGVQPWLDVPEMGCSTVSVTNNDPVAGQQQADALATAFWAARGSSMSS